MGERSFANLLDLRAPPGRFAVGRALQPDTRRCTHRRVSWKESAAEYRHRCRPERPSDRGEAKPTQRLSPRLSLRSLRLCIHAFRFLLDLLSLRRDSILHREPPEAWVNAVG